METNQQGEATGTSHPSAESRLVKFVADNRQHLPALPEKLPAITIPPAELEAVRLEREARDAKRAEARRRGELNSRAAELIREAGERYRHCTLDNFDCTGPEQRAIIHELREYLDGDCCCGVILYGPVGTGKDHLAFAVCRAAVLSGKRVSWINGQKWFGIVRDSMDTDKSEASLIMDLARPELLCLSDPLPPVGQLTQFQATMLYRLVDARYSRGLPTICTINVHDDAEADERMGEATWDRLTHDSWKLKCDWPTYRKPGRER